MWTRAVLAALLIGVVGSWNGALSQVKSFWGMEKAYTCLVRTPLGIPIIDPANNPYWNIGTRTQKYKLERNPRRKFYANDFAAYCAPRGGDGRFRNMLAPFYSEGSDGHIKRGGLTAIHEAELHGGRRVADVTKSYPGTLIRGHFIQLALHHMQLPPEYNSTHDARESDRRGKKNHPPVASVYSINKSLICYGILIVSYFLMAAGIGSLYRRRLSWSTFLVAASVLAAYHSFALIFGL